MNQGTRAFIRTRFIAAKTLLPLFALISIHGAALAALKPRVMETQFKSDDFVIASVVATEAPFNALPDGRQDCTRAIQMAINAVEKEGGGVVFLPTGRYRCEGSLVLKETVTLRGDWQSPEVDPKVAGTILMPTGGRGKADGPPFILLERGSCLRNLSIWYPEQDATAIVAYPWTLKTDPGKTGDNTTVHQVTLVNPYQAIKIGPDWNELHAIRQVYGSPLKCGIWMDFTTDIGRLVHIRFGPGYWLESGLVQKEQDAAASVRRFMAENGTGVEVLRSDWEYFFDVKLQGYQKGIHFHQGETGSPNAVLYDVAATDGEVGLWLDQLNSIGLSLTRCRFDGSQAGVWASSRFSEVSQFNACELGGRAGQAVHLEGNGRLSFQNCAFTGWKEAAVAASAGSLNLMGCEFKQAGNHVRLGAAVQRAHMIGNRFASKANISNASKGDIQIAEGNFHFATPNMTPVSLPPDRRPATEKLFLATDFGSKPDGKTDNTSMLQAALDAAGKGGGGTVYLSPGLYRCNGALNVPGGVELRGCFDGPHHTVSAGSTLMPTAGRNQENGEPFISLQPGSGLRGLTIWYPEQDIDHIVPYPWTIRSMGGRCWLMDVTAGNPYRLADFATHPSDGGLIRYLSGAPLRCGLRVSGSGGVVDSGMFNPHYWFRKPGEFPQPNGEPLSEKQFRDLIGFMQRNLDAFVFGRCASSLQVNNFVYGPHRGLYFVDDGGGAHARVINHGSDGSGCGVVVEAADPAGIEMVNTEMTTFGPTATTALWVSDAFAGKLDLFNSMSWGENNPSAKIHGKGHVLLQSWNSTIGPFDVQGGWVDLQNLYLQSLLTVPVTAGPRIESLDLMGNTLLNDDEDFPAPEGAHVTAHVNSARIPPVRLKDRFATSLESGGPRPIADQIDNVSNLTDGSCHAEEGVGRKPGGAAIVITGEHQTKDHAYIYYKVFDVNIEIKPDTVFRYWIRPETDFGAFTGLDLYFDDGTTLRDSQAVDSYGRSLHPCTPKGPVGEWTKIECVLGRAFAGKTLQTIALAYDHDKGPGSFRAIIDDIEIGEPVENSSAAPAAVSLSTQTLNQPLTLKKQ